MYCMYSIKIIAFTIPSGMQEVDSRVTQGSHSFTVQLTACKDCFCASSSSCMSLHYNSSHWVLLTATVLLPTLTHEENTSGTVRADNSSMQVESQGSLEGRWTVRVTSQPATWYQSHHKRKSFKTQYAAAKEFLLMVMVYSTNCASHFPSINKMYSHSTCKCKINSCISLSHCKVFACKDSLQLTVLLLMIKRQWSKKCGWPQTSCQIINLIIA